MSIIKRKSQHIDICLRKTEKIYKQGTSLSALRLKHRAFPDIRWEDLSSETSFLGKSLSFPFLVGSMSGGNRASKILNRNLARACHETGAALALGSSRIMLEKQGYSQTFSLRKEMPQGLILINLGINQLNEGLEIHLLEQMVQETEADGLILHVNPAQELLQPEGDRSFKGQIDLLREVCSKLKVPLGIKETGMGFSKEDINALKGIPLSFIDAAGNDGTNWALVEGFRGNAYGRKESVAFKGWGYSTLESLQHCLALKPSCPVIASGGLRNSLDMVKAMAMGASLCSMALPLLKPAMKSAKHITMELLSLKKNFKRAMLLCGIGDIESLVGNQDLIFSESDSR